MSEKTFIVTGSYTQNNAEKKFEKEITAVTGNYAKEKTLSLLGSKHKIKRSSAKISGVKEKKG